MRVYTAWAMLLVATQTLGFDVAVPAFLGEVDKMNDFIRQEYLKVLREADRNGVTITDELKGAFGDFILVKTQLYDTVCSEYMRSLEARVEGGDMGVVWGNEKDIGCLGINDGSTGSK